MAKFLPPKRPQFTRSELRGFVLKNDPGIANALDWEVVNVFGIRGYYLDSMGEPGKNDRSIYDDAIIISSPSFHATFNGNTDPNGYRKGHGKSDATKGIAALKEGLYWYKLGLHKGQYLALIQAGDVTVRRDADRLATDVYRHEGRDVYEEKGRFGINIHRGGYSTVSSIGCQTIYPTQYDAFIQSIKSEMGRYGIKQVHYCLISNT